MSQQGTVKFFTQARGYGFIVLADGSELFVHATQVNGNPLQEGDNVVFDVGFDDKRGDSREIAVNVAGGTGVREEFGKKGGKGKGKFGGGGYDGGKSYSKGGYGGGYGGGGYGY
jgi:cold shock CspA family protein